MLQLSSYFFYVSIDPKHQNQYRSIDFFLHRYTARNTIAEIVIYIRTYRYNYLNEITYLVIW